MTSGVEDEADSMAEASGEVWMARDGNGETSPGLCTSIVCDGCVEMVNLGCVVTTTLHEGLQRGEMGAAAAFLASAERG